MTSVQSHPAMVHPTPIAFLSLSHRIIPAELQAIAAQATADLVRRLGLKSTRLGPDCFCGFLRRRDPCGRYDCDLRDLSRKFLDHSTLLTSFAGERLLMGSNYTDDDRKNWHLGPAAREPIGEDAERLRYVGLSWEILETSPYFPGHTTSIVFRREKRPRGRYAPPHAQVKKRLVEMLHEGLLTTADVQQRAEENVAIARRKLDEALAVGDTDRTDRATTIWADCTKTNLQAGVAMLKTMRIAMEFIAEVRASTSQSERREREQQGPSGTAS